MMRKRPLVSVVEDDESLRESLSHLIRQFGLAAEAFASAEAFLASDVVSETSGPLLDNAKPGMSGPIFKRNRNGGDRPAHRPWAMTAAASAECGGRPIPGSLWTLLVEWRVFCGIAASQDGHRDWAGVDTPAFPHEAGR